MSKKTNKKMSADERYKRQTERTERLLNQIHYDNAKNSYKKTDVDSLYKQFTEDDDLTASELYDIRKRLNEYKNAYSQFGDGSKTSFLNKFQNEIDATWKSYEDGNPVRQLAGEVATKQRETEISTSNSTRSSLPDYRYNAEAFKYADKKLMSAVLTGEKKPTLLEIGAATKGNQHLDPATNFAVKPKNETELRYGLYFDDVQKEIDAFKKDIEKYETLSEKAYLTDDKASKAAAKKLLKKYGASNLQGLYDALAKKEEQLTTLKNVQSDYEATGLFTDRNPSEVSYDIMRSLTPEQKKDMDEILDKDSVLDKVYDALTGRYGRTVVNKSKATDISDLLQSKYGWTPEKADYYGKNYSSARDIFNTNKQHDNFYRDSESYTDDEKKYLEQYIRGKDIGWNGGTASILAGGLYGVAAGFYSAHQKSKAEEELKKLGWTDERIEEEAKKYRVVSNTSDYDEMVSRVSGDISESTGKTIGWNVADQASFIPSALLAATETARQRFGGEYTNPYASGYYLNNIANVTEQATNEHIKNPTGQFLYGAVMSMGKSAQTMALGMALGGATEGVGASEGVGKLIANIATLPAFGSTSYQSALKEGMERGLGQEHAVEFATASGINEMAFEILSMDKAYDLFKKGGKDLLAQGYKSAFKDMAMQGLIEGSEEVLTGTANLFADMAINSDFSEFKDLEKRVGTEAAIKKTLGEIGKEGLAGTLSGIAMGGGTLTVSLGNAYSTTQTVLNNEAATNSIINSALEMDQNSKAYQIASKLNGKPSSWQMMQMIASASGESSFHDAVKASLVEAGIGESAAEESIKNIVAATVTGNTDNLSEQEQRQYANFAGGKYDTNISAGNVLSAVETAARQKAESDRIEKEYKENGVVKGESAVSDIAREGTVAAKMQELAESDKVSNEDGIEISGVESNDNGELILKTASGETINSDDAIYKTTSEAIVYDTIKEKGLSVELANSVVAEMNKGTITPAKLVSDVSLALDYGKTNMRSALANLSIPETLANDIFKEGRNIAYKEDSSKHKFVASNEQSKVVYENGVKRESLKGKQRASVEAAELLASVTKGLEIHVLESYEKGGEHFFNVNGEEIDAGVNGWYVTDTGKIYFDINAGGSYQGLGIFTLAHETGHYLRDINPVAWRKLADVIVAEIDSQARGTNKPTFADILAVKERSYFGKRANEKIGYANKSDEEIRDMAYEDVIADSLSSLLADKETFVRMSENLKAKDQNAWQQVKDFIKNLLDKIDKFLKSYKGVQVEEYAGRAIQNANETVRNEIRDLYVSAFEVSDTVDSSYISENYSGVPSIGTEVVSEEMNSDRTFTTPQKKFIMPLGSGKSKLFNKGQELTTYEVLEQIATTRTQKAKLDTIKSTLDEMSRFMRDAGVKYRYLGLEDVNNASITYDADTGRYVFSAMVKNGEYPVNFDFTTICKKRDAASFFIDKILSENDENGKKISQTYRLTQRNLFLLNEAMRESGYETACLGCFVEAKRYNADEWASTIVREWNESVDKYNSNAEFLIDDGKDISVADLSNKQIEQICNNIDTVLKDNTTLKKQEAFKRNLAEAKEKVSVAENDLEIRKDALKAAQKELKNASTEKEVIKATKKVEKAEKAVATGETKVEKANNKVQKLLNQKKQESSITPAEKADALIQSDQKYQKKIKISDLLTKEGIRTISQEYPELLTFIKTRYGTATPKLTQGFTPYNSEIALLPETKGKNQSLADYLYSIAGIRTQSFSDFKIEYVFDYLQMFADAYMRDLPMHAYTKEISFAKLFGKMGAKINMSVMYNIMDESYWGSHLDALEALGETETNLDALSKKYAGMYIDDNGQLAPLVADQNMADYFKNKYGVTMPVQSVGYSEAVELMKQDGYTQNIGTIAVGYGDYLIRQLLNDNDIRYVIPYHSSSLPVEVKSMANLKYARDYTSVQNTLAISTMSVNDEVVTFKKWMRDNGFNNITSENACDVVTELNNQIKAGTVKLSTKKASAGHGDFNLYTGENGVRNTNDPKETVNRYVADCLNKGQLPMFYEFADEENYYKLHYDFNVYDNVTGEYAPQTSVGYDIGSMDEFKDTVDSYMKEMNTYREEQYTEDKVAETIDRWKDKVDFANVLNSDRDSDGNTLSPEQIAYFKDSKVRDENGNLLAVYHGSNNDFTVFDKNQKMVNGRVLGDGFYFAPSEEKASRWAKGKVYKTYINITNPYYASADDSIPSGVLEILKENYGETYDNLKDTVTSRGAWWGAKYSRDEWIDMQLENKNAEDALSNLVKIPENIPENEVNEYSAKEKRRILEELGYDGIIYKDSKNNFALFGGEQYVAFYPNQIKSVDNTNPTDSADIRYSDRIEASKGDVTELDLRSQYEIDNNIEMGININDKSQDFTGQILAGEKTIETRDNRKLDSYIGTRVALVRTGKGKATIVGYATVGEPIAYTSKKKFDADYSKHRVGKDSPYYIKSGIKYGYPMLDVVSAEETRQIDSKGIVSRSIKYQARAKQTDALKNAEHLKEADLDELMSFCKAKLLDDGTRIPVRKSTPSAVRIVAVEMMKRMSYPQSEIEKIAVFDRPMDAEVWKIRQALAPYTERFGKSHGHELTETELKDVLERMKDPEYIIFEEKHNRYNVVVRHPRKDSKIKWVYAVVQFNENFDAEYMNGYEGRDYNTTVTIYPPDKNEEFKSLLARARKKKYVYDRNQIKALSQRSSDIQVSSLLNDNAFDERIPSNEISVKTSLRDTNATDNRTLLSNALLEVAQNEIEEKKIAEYQSKIATINEAQNELSELRAEIKELSFAKGKRDTAKIKSLQEEATKIANRISTYDKQLLRLEASKPLMDVLEREKNKAYKKAKDAGKEALDRYRENSLKKQQELADMYRERIERNRDKRKATDTRNKIKNIRSELEGVLRGKSKDNYIPVELVNGVIDVCNMIDPTGENQNTKSAQKYRSSKEALEALKEQYDRLDPEAVGGLNSMEYFDYTEEYERAFSNMIKSLADKLGDKPLRDLTKAELEDVYDVLSQIKHTVVTARQLIGYDQTMTTYEGGQNIIRNMYKIVRNGINKGFLTKGKGGIVFRNWMENPMRAVNEISAFDEDSMLVKAFKDFDNGRIKADTFKMEVDKTFERHIDTNRKAFNEAVEKTIDLKMKDKYGKQIKLTKMQMMSAMLTWEREISNENRKHLESLVIFPDAKLERNGKHSEALDNSVRVMITDEMIERFQNEMSEWDNGYLDLARQFFRETSRDAIDSTMLQIKGRLIATENNYFPYTVNRDYVKTEPEALKYDSTILGMGMLKSVVNNAPQGLVMQSLNGVIDNHASQVAKVYGLAIPTRNWNKLYNMMQTREDGGESVKDVIRQTWGSSTIKMLEQTVTDLQASRKHESIPVLGKFKQAFVVSTLASNISVWMKQAASYPTAGAVLSGTSLTKGLADYSVSNKQKLFDEIDEHTSQHYIRRKGMSAPEVGAINQTGGLNNKVNRALGKAAKINPMNWIQAMDVATTGAIWCATKAEVKSMGYTVGSEEYWNKVTELYNKTLAETQPMYDSLHRAEVTKNGALSFIMFQTQPLQNSGILREGTQRYRMAVKMYGKNSAEAKNASKVFRKAVVSQVASHLVFTTMTLAAAAMTHSMNPYRDDDDELTFESILEEFGKQFGKNIFNAILPIAGNYIAAFGDYIMGNSQYDILSDPIIDKANIILKDAAKIKEPTPENAEKLVMDVASLFGVPLANAKKIAKGIRLHIEDAVNGEFGSFEAGIERKMQQNLNIAYRASLDGDMDKLDRIMEDVDEEKLTAAITTKFKADYIEADINGDNATKADIEKFMSDIGFDSEEIEAKTNSWLKDDANTELGKEAESEREAKAKSKEIKQNVFNAVDSGNASDIKTSVKAMIDDKKSKGKTEKEAKSDIRSALTTEYKPIFLEAYKNKDNNKMASIRKALKATGCYEDIVKTTQDWIKNSKKK